MNWFVQKAKEIHGDKYDYSKVVFVNTKEKVTITCPIHGDFKQVPGDHIYQKSGCRNCANDELSRSKLSTTEDFIQKVKKIHDDKYDYSKVIYVNAHTKVIITCHEHGDFEQSPTNHLSGKGCPICGDESMKQKQQLSVEEFIEKAKAVHNDEYDYSKVDYVNNRTKVRVTCPAHGDFFVTPANHLNNRGCPFCRASKGELTVKAILDRHNVKYQREYRIPEVLEKLFYDFYLPEYNVLIEFHGIQHYQYIPFFHNGNEDDYLAQKTRDDVKRYLAKYFKYRYLELNYQQLKQLSVEDFEKLILRALKAPG